ncbi:MAG: hypothetical protein PHP86_05650 [Nevskiales bacterium]|nr:hypothetical protein [Nevskiales bacterium]
MYVGHLAVGFALKARYPQVPSLPIMFGVGFMDLVNGVLVILGVDRITANPDAGPYLFFDLTFIDWDHSLLMAAVLALVWALFFRRDPTVAVIAALAVFSHFLTDWPVHNGDLALAPYSQTHFGGGLWGSLGIYAWLLEGLFAAALAGYAWLASARRGVDLRWPCVVLAVLFLQLSPWLSPMRFIAALDEPAAHLIAGVMVTSGFLIPGLLLTWLFERAESRGTG